MHRREVGLGVVALAVSVVCVRLGVWQLDRLAERRARNAEVRAARERPPIALTGLGLPADSARQRRLLARGVLDYAHERVWPARSYQGAPGVHLITPLRLPDGVAVLVDRGWVPSYDARQVDRAAFREAAETVAVLGLGLLGPRGRGDVDPQMLGDSLPYPVLPFLVQWGPPPSLPGAPAPVRAPGRPPVRVVPSALDDGPHLMYAVQWFSFAAIAVVGTGLLLRKASREDV
ncbi:MAG: SURF1 family protein [Gemmatimonadales bacterium]